MSDIEILGEEILAEERFDEIHDALARQKSRSELSKIREQAATAKGWLCDDFAGQMQIHLRTPLSEFNHAWIKVLRSSFLADIQAAHIERIVSTHSQDLEDTRPEADPVAIERTFRVLEAQWLEDTADLSSPSEKFSHPAFRAIVDMGKYWGDPVITLLLRDLSERPRHWVRALREITGLDVSRKEDRGNLEKITARWLEYGKERGLL